MIELILHTHTGCVTFTLLQCLMQYLPILVLGCHILAGSPLIVATVGKTLLSILFGLVFCLLLVDEIETTGLNLFVKEGTSEASNELFGLLMANGLAVRNLMLLICLGSLIGRSTSNELVGDVRLVLGALLVVIVILSVLVVVVEKAHDVNVKCVGISFLQGRRKGRPGKKNRRKGR